MSAGHSTKRVLVVDDDEGVRSVLCDVLSDAGYDPVAASDGREAMECLRTAKPCVILLDLTMPVMDGWAFRQWQRTVPGIASIPVILLSALRDVRVQAASLGVAAYVQKPVRLETLLGAVAAHC